MLGLIAFWYILDIVFDLKTLNVRLDNHLTIPSILIYNDKEYECVSVLKLDNIKNKNIAAEGFDFSRIISVNGMEYIAFYKMKINL